MSQDDEWEELQREFEREIEELENHKGPDWWKIIFWGLIGVGLILLIMACTCGE